MDLLTCTVLFSWLASAICKATFLLMDRLFRGLSALRLPDKVIFNNNRLTDSFSRFVATETRRPAVFPTFVKSHFNEVKKENPSLKSTEIMKKLSEMYRTTPSTELAKLTLSAPISNAKSEETKSEERKKRSVIFWLICLTV